MAAAHERRQRIIDATIETIGEHGLAATRIKEIARRAGTSAGLVMYHFSTLEGVIEAALEASEAALFEEIDEQHSVGTTAPLRLRTLAELSGDPDTVSGNWTLWMELWVHALRNKHAAQLRAKVEARWRSKLHEVITDGIASGHFHCGDPTASTLRLSALLDGLWVEVALGGEDATPERMIELWLTSASIELHCARELLGPPAATVRCAIT